MGGVGCKQKNEEKIEIGRLKDIRVQNEREAVKKNDTKGHSKIQKDKKGEKERDRNQRSTNKKRIAVECNETICDPNMTMK